MMTEHSAGPWQRNATIVWSPAGEAVVCVLSEPHPESHLVIHEELRLGSNGWDEAMANGDLIEMAPDLLALVEAVEWDQDGFCLWCGNILHKDDCPRQRALARARGDGVEDDDGFDDGSYDWAKPDCMP
jgi:hypothetical protein